MIKISLTQFFRSAFFQCRITGGIPEPSIEWRRSDGSPFTSNVEISEGLLQFKQVNFKDTGTYECIAHNSGKN